MSTVPCFWGFRLKNDKNCQLYQVVGGKPDTVDNFYRFLTENPQNRVLSTSFAPPRLLEKSLERSKLDLGGS